MIRENEILKEYNTQLCIFIFSKSFFLEKILKKSGFIEKKAWFLFAFFFLGGLIMVSILMIRENEILKEYNTQLFIFIFSKIFFF